MIRSREKKNGEKQMSPTGSADDFTNKTKSTNTKRKHHLATFAHMHTH